VAELHVIFRLPPELGQMTGYLAYIHWFRPFRAIDPATGMYRLSRSTRNNRPNAAIVPLSDVLRACHLCPWFSSAVDLSWKTETVLEQATEFLLNKHIDLYMFDRLRLHVPN
ncbi:hypothetical protein NEOLEDRAFT_1056163, partial [Neolentinus lepideus HHB14362 ss-1]